MSKRQTTGLSRPQDRLRAGTRCRGACRYCAGGMAGGGVPRHGRCRGIRTHRSLSIAILPPDTTRSGSRARGSTPSRVARRTRPHGIRRVSRFTRRRPARRPAVPAARSTTGWGPGRPAAVLRSAAGSAGPAVPSAGSARAAAALHAAAAPAEAEVLARPAQGAHWADGARRAYRDHRRRVRVEQALNSDCGHRGGEQLRISVSSSVIRRSQRGSEHVCRSEHVRCSR